MSTQVQLKRGTTAQNNTYTGAIGEITVDTTLKQLRLHDGSTAGGTIIGSSAVTVTTATNIAGGTAGQIAYQTAAGATSFFGPGTAGTVLVSYGASGTPTFQNTLTLAGTTVATSTQTGALVVGGGVGIGGNLYVGGSAYFTGDLYVDGTQTILNSTNVQTGDKVIYLTTTSGTALAASNSGIGIGPTTGVYASLLFDGVSSWKSVGSVSPNADATYNLGTTALRWASLAVSGNVTATTFVGNLSGNLVSPGTGNIIYQSASNTTSFLSTGTSGQLLVAAGGAPVWTNTGSIYIYRATLADLATTATNAGTAYATIASLSTGTGFYGGSFNGSVNQTWSLNTATLMTTSVNLAGGVAGSVPYQTAAGTTAMLGLGTSGYVLTAGASAPQWSAISGLSAGNATTASNLANGQPGYIPYQTAPGSTSFINSATTGYFLQGNYSGAPTWTSTASMYVQNAVTATSAATAYSTIASLSTGTGLYGGSFNGSSAQTWSLNTATLMTTAVNIAGGTAGQLVYQSGAGATSFTGPGSYGQFLMSTGASAPVYQSTLTQANGNIVITSNSAASSTITGALQIVNGGLGIGGDIYAGGSMFLGSNARATTSAFYTNNTLGNWNGHVVQRAGTEQWFAGSDNTNGQYVIRYNANWNWLAINTYTGVVTVSTNTSVSSAATGALVVNGGLGVAGGGFFGGIVTATTYYGTFAGTIGGITTINTASNLANGTAGQVPYQSAPGVTAFINTATTGYFLQANYVGAPTWTSSGTIQVGYAANILGAGTGNLVYQSGNNTTALLSTGTTGQLLMAAGGAPVFTNTSSVYVAAATQVNTLLQTASANYYPAFVSANNATSSAMSLYTTSSFYINPASGNTVVGGTLTVNSSAYNTATNTANAIYTPGGIYTDGGLTVGSNGPVLFKGPVTFSGSATYVLSTNTFYTDNIIEMHTPPGGVSANWNLDDGKDIGFRFHYYTNSTDTNAALVLANDSKYLEWYSAGAESTGSAFTSATYGTFKTGVVKLVSGTANSNNTNSGDLQVLGGVGIGGSIYVAGNITVAGAINATVNGTITSATNIAGGTAGQIHYQSAPGLTAFAGPGTAGQVLVSGGTGAPVYQSTLTLSGTTSATSTTTGALVVAGGVGIGGNIYFNGNLYQNGVLFTSGSTSTTSTFTINNTTTSVSTTTGALVVQGGVGIGGSVYIGGTVTGGGIRSTSTSTAPTNATVGDIWYKTDTDDIYRYTNDGTTTTSYWLDITGPTVANLTSITASNIANGTAGQLVYQSSANITAFVNTATTGNFLQANYVGAPTWASTASIYVNRATLSDTATTATSAAFAYSFSTSTLVTNSVNAQVATTATNAATAYTTIGTITAGTGLTGTAFNGSANQTWNATGSTINSQSGAYVLVASDAGKTISITTGGVTIPNAVMSAGNIVSIYNNSGSSQTITQGSSLTLQWAGQSSSTTGNRTLGLYGMASIIFITSSLAVITGSGLT